MTKSVRFQLSRSGTRRGHDKIQAVVRVKVHINNGRWQFFDFVFDTGASVSLFPLDRAKRLGIFVEQIPENATDPPITKRGPLRGYWGKLRILLLDHRPELTCFFFDVTAENEPIRAGVDTPLEDLINDLPRDPDDTKPDVSTALIGMANFIDSFDVLIQDDHIHIIREKSPSLWNRLWAWFQSRI